MNGYSIHLACLGALLGLLTVSAAAFGGLSARQGRAARADSGGPASAEVGTNQAAAFDPEAVSGTRTEVWRMIDEEAAPAFALQPAAEAPEGCYYVALRIHTAQLPTSLDLCGADGTVLETLAPEDGDVILGPLPPDCYTLRVVGLTLGSFSLQSNAALAEATDYLWTDGELLHLSDYVAARADFWLYVPGPGSYRFRLVSAAGIQREIRFTVPETADTSEADRSRVITVFGLRPGTYQLYCGGSLLCAFSARPGQQVLREIRLP